MNITSRQLRAFLLTARYQSFSRAADQLFITQSGMSVLVRELEAQLGFRLFERTTRRVTLTEFGSKFLPIAERSLVDLESAAASKIALSSRIRGACGLAVKARSAPGHPSTTLIVAIGSTSAVQRISLAPDLAKGEVTNLP